MLTKDSSRSLIADKSHIAQTVNHEMNRNIDGNMVFNATLRHWTGDQQHPSRKRANFCSVTALVTEDCETTENVTNGQVEVEVPLQRLHHQVLRRYSIAYLFAAPFSVKRKCELSCDSAPGSLPHASER